MKQSITFVILMKSMLSLYVKGSAGKYVEGHLIVAEKWHFVARFCFLSEHGQFEYFVEYDKEYAVQSLLLYYDTEDQWPAVYKTKKTCEEKEAVLIVNRNQKINLTEKEISSGCAILRTQPNSTLEKHAIISCHNARRFQSARPRWWFLAVSHCDSTNGLNLKYKFLLTNGHPGDWWREHFSADEFYIMPILGIFSIIYLVILFATVSCAVELKARQLLHSTYKLFALSVTLQEMGIIFQCIAYLRYAFNGIGFPMIQTLGRMLESASEICFLLLLLLMAKGYTITRGRLRLSSSVKLTIFMCTFVVTTLTLFIYEQHVFDPGEVLYLYESPAGYGLMILRIAAWWIFEYSTLFTLKHYPEKSNFYTPFNLMGTLWFVAGPCFILTANSLIDKWIRESVACAVYHLIASCGHILFFLLTVPNKANKNFPYHVRTSQIGVMEMTNVANAADTYNFSHHAYEPYPTPLSIIESERSRICPSDVPIDLFTVSQPSPQFQSQMERFNIAKTEINQKDSLTDEKADNTDTNNEKKLETFGNSTVQSTGHLNCTDSGEEEKIISDDRFIAPSLRENKTASSS